MYEEGYHSWLDAGMIAKIYINTDGQIKTNGKIPGTCVKGAQ